MKAELLSGLFRGCMAREPKTKNVSHETLNSKHNCPWLALGKEQIFTVLLWLVTALQLPEQIPAGALDFHPQPWGLGATDQIISPTLFRSIPHGELVPVRAVSSQLLLWTVEIWIIWMKWWFLKCSAFTGIQELAFPQWVILKLYQPTFSPSSPVKVKYKPQWILPDSFGFPVLARLRQRSFGICPLEKFFFPSTVVSSFKICMTLSKKKHLSLDLSLSSSFLKDFFPLQVLTIKAGLHETHLLLSFQALPAL